MAVKPLHVKKRIEENLDTKNPVLDLGNCGLNGTQPELDALADCVHLEKLIFSSIKQQWNEDALS